MANTSLIRTALPGRFARRVRHWPPSAVRPPAICATPVIQVAASDAGSRFVPLGIGKSVVIDLPRDTKDVLVADPKIANAVVRSARRAYIIGVDGRPDQRLLLRRRGPPDRRLRHRGHARPQRRARRAQAGAAEADIHVEGVGDGVVLSGNVASPGEAQQAFDIACAPRRRRQQGRQRHHRARPRPGDAQGHGRGSAARRHQAARHRSQRQRRLRHRGAQFQQRPIRSRSTGQRADRLPNAVTAHAGNGDQRARCARWSAPA